jgi:hypothetical protein
MASASLNPFQRSAQKQSGGTPASDNFQLAAATAAKFDPASSKYSGTPTNRFLQFIRLHPNVMSNCTYVQSDQIAVTENDLDQSADVNHNITPTELPAPGNVKEKRNFFSSLFGGKDKLSKEKEKDKNDKGKDDKEKDKQKDSTLDSSHQHTRDLPVVTLELADPTQLDVSSSPSIVVILRLALIASHSMMGSILHNYSLSKTVVDKLIREPVGGHAAIAAAAVAAMSPTNKKDKAPTNNQSDPQHDSHYQNNLPHRQHHFIDLLNNSFFLSSLSKSYVLSPALFVEILTTTLADAQTYACNYALYRQAIKEHKRRCLAEYLRQLQFEYMTIYNLTSMSITMQNVSINPTSRVFPYTIPRNDNSIHNGLISPKSSDKEPNILLNPNKLLEMITHNQLICLDPFTLAESLRSWIVQSTALSQGNNSYSEQNNTPPPSAPDDTTPLPTSVAAVDFTNMDSDPVSTTSSLSMLRPGESIPAHPDQQLIFALDSSDHRSPTPLVIPNDSDNIQAFLPKSSTPTSGYFAPCGIVNEIGGALSPHFEDEDTSSNIGCVVTEADDPSRWETYHLAPLDGKNHTASDSLKPPVKQPITESSRYYTAQVIPNQSNSTPTLGHAKLNYQPSQNQAYFSNSENLANGSSNPGHGETLGKAQVTGGTDLCPTFLRSISHFTAPSSARLSKLQLCQSPEYLLPLLETMYLYSIMSASFIEFVSNLSRQTQVNSVNSANSASTSPHPSILDPATALIESTPPNDFLSSEYNNRQSMSFVDLGCSSTPWLSHPNDRHIASPNASPFNLFAPHQLTSPSFPYQISSTLSDVNTVNNYWSLFRSLKGLFRYEVTLLSDLLAFFSMILITRAKMSGARPVIYDQDDIHSTYFLTPKYCSILQNNTHTDNNVSRSERTPINSPQVSGSVLESTSSGHQDSLSFSLLIDLLLTESRYSRHKLFHTYNERSKISQRQQQEVETHHSQHLDRQLAKERLTALQSRSVLVTGSSQVGKNTYIKQTMRLYTNGFRQLHQDVADHLMFLRIVLIFKAIIYHSDVRTLGKAQFNMLVNPHGANSVSLHITDHKLNPFKFKDGRYVPQETHFESSISNEQDFYAISPRDAREIVSTFKLETYNNQREFVYQEQSHVQNGGQRTDATLTILDEIRTTILIACCVLWSDPASRLIHDNRTKLEFPSDLSPYPTDHPLHFRFQDGDLHLLSRLQYMALAPHRAGYVTNADIVSLHALSSYNVLYLSAKSLPTNPHIPSSSYKQILGGVLETEMNTTHDLYEGWGEEKDSSDTTECSYDVISQPSQSSVFSRRYPVIHNVPQLQLAMQRFRDVRHRICGLFPRLGHPQRIQDKHVAVIFQLANNRDIENVNGCTITTRITRETFLETGSYLIDSLQSPLDDVGPVLYATKPGYLTYIGSAPARPTLPEPKSLLENEHHPPTTKPERKRSLFARREESAGPVNRTSSQAPGLATSPSMLGTPTLQRTASRNTRDRSAIPFNRSGSIQFESPSPQAGGNNSKLTRLTGGGLTMQRQSKEQLFVQEVLHFHSQNLLDPTFVPPRSLSYNLLSSRSEIFQRFVQYMTAYTGTTNLETQRSRVNMQKYLNPKSHNGSGGLFANSTSFLDTNSLNSVFGSGSTKLPGQQSESAINSIKFLAQLDSNDVIMHVVSLASYADFDEKNNNVFLSQLSEVQGLLSSPVLNDKPIVVVLNKVDLFMKRLQTIPLSTCFKTYQERITAHPPISPVPGSHRYQQQHHSMMASRSQSTFGSFAGRPTNVNTSALVSYQQQQLQHQQHTSPPQNLPLPTFPTLANAFLNFHHERANQPHFVQYYVPNLAITAAHVLPPAPTEEAIVKIPHNAPGFKDNDQLDNLEEAVRYIRRELIRIVHNAVQVNHARLNDNSHSPHVIPRLLNIHAMVDDWYSTTSMTGINTAIEATNQPPSKDGSKSYVRPVHVPAQINPTSRRKYINDYGTRRHYDVLDDGQQQQLLEHQNLSAPINPHFHSQQLDFESPLNMAFMVTTPSTNHGYGYSNEPPQAPLVPIPTPVPPPTTPRNAIASTHNVAPPPQPVRDLQGPVTGRPVIFAFTSFSDPYAIEELSILNFLATSNSELTKYSVIAEDPSAFIKSTDEDNKQQSQLLPIMPPGTLHRVQSRLINSPSAFSPAQHRASISTNPTLNRQGTQFVGLPSHPLPSAQRYQVQGKNGQQIGIYDEREGADAGGDTVPALIDPILTLGPRVHQTNPHPGRPRGPSFQQRFPTRRNNFQAMLEQTSPQTGQQMFGTGGSRFPSAGAPLYNTNNNDTNPPASANTDDTFGRKSIGGYQ